MALKTNPALVHRIDKSDESSRQIALVEIHPRHVGNDKCIVMPHQLEIICRTGSRSDQLIKSEQRGLAARLWNLDLAAPDHLGGRVGRVVDRVAQEVEPLAGVLIGFFAQRVVVHLGRGTGNLAVIRWRVEVDDVQGGFEERDARNKRFALDAVFV